MAAMDSVSEQRLEQVIPELAQKIELVNTALIYQGIYIRVVQGLRDQSVQAQLYAQGRTAPGDVVTDAPPGYSMHEFGLAVDCMPSLNGVGGVYKPDGVAGSPRYVAMIAAGEAQGLVSGSTWIHMKDWPHFQLAGIPETPTDEMRTDFAAGGLPLVWDKALSGSY